MADTKMVVNSTNWELNQTSSSQIFKATLTTNGTYLTKDITLSIKAKDGILSRFTATDNQIVIPSINAVTDSTDENNITTKTATTTKPVSGYYLEVQSSNETTTITVSDGVEEAGWLNESNREISRVVTVQSSPVTYIPVDSAVLKASTGSVCAVASDGHASIASNGIWNSETESYDTTTKLITTAVQQNGYYSITATGNGEVTSSGGGAITVANSGWIASGVTTTSSASSEVTTKSKDGTATYYIKNSIIDQTTVSASTATQTIKVGEGYYHADREITITGMAAGALTNPLTFKDLSTNVEITQTTPVVALINEESSANLGTLTTSKPVEGAYIAVNTQSFSVGVESSATVTQSGYVNDQSTVTNNKNLKINSAEIAYIPLNTATYSDATLYGNLTKYFSQVTDNSEADVNITPRITVTESGYSPENNITYSSAWNVKKGTLTVTSSAGVASDGKYYAYQNISDAIVPTEGALIINEGWYSNSRILLSTLIPEGTETYSVAADSHMLQGYKAFNTDGQELVGTIVTTTLNDTYYSTSGVEASKIRAQSYIPNGTDMYIRTGTIAVKNDTQTVSTSSSISLTKDLEDTRNILTNTTSISTSKPDSGYYVIVNADEHSVTTTMNAYVSQSGWLDADSNVTQPVKTTVNSSTSYVNIATGTLTGNVIAPSFALNSNSTTISMGVVNYTTTPEEDVEYAVISSYGSVQVHATGSALSNIETAGWLPQGTNAEVSINEDTTQDFNTDTVSYYVKIYDGTFTVTE